MNYLLGELLSGVFHGGGDAAFVFGWVLSFALVILLASIAWTVAFGITRWVLDGISKRFLKWKINQALKQARSNLGIREPKV